MQAVRHVTGAGEHHVLEQMGEAGAAGLLVLRADVIQHLDGDGRGRVVLRENDREPVRQRVPLERNSDSGGAALRSAIALCGRCDGDGTEQRERD